MGNKKIFNIVEKEDFISMILGLLIVGVVVIVLINYFKSRSGRVNLDGLSDVVITEEGQNDQSKDQSKTYEVVAGDNLWKIASSYYNDGYRWVDIAKANGIAIQQANKLLVGQKLNIPMERVSDSVSTTHLVVTGDSLSKLALNYYGDMYAWEKIWQANKDKVYDPKLIFPGISLVIPK